MSFDVVASSRVERDTATPWEHALSIGLYCGITALALAMIGLLSVFIQRPIIVNVLSLSYALLCASFLAAGMMVASRGLFSNPVLGRTYARVLSEAQAAGGDRVKQIEAARKAWYKGFVAEAIDTFCRTQSVMDVSGRPHKGLLTGDDMARWQAPVEAPLTYDYGRYTVAKCGPWNQGPVLLQQLALLSGSGIEMN